MTEFSQKRFVDIGQQLFINTLNNDTWVRCLGNNEKERLNFFATRAQYCFEAAEEFAEVFRHQEDN